VSQSQPTPAEEFASFASFPEDDDDASAFARFDEEETTSPLTTGNTAAVEEKREGGDSPLQQRRSALLSQDDDPDLCQQPLKKSKKKVFRRRRRPKKMIRAAWSVCKRVAERCQRLSTWFFASRQGMDGGLLVYKGSLLAEGGFSYVYLGYDALTGRELVLKEVRVEEPEQMVSVLREIQAHKRFAHKNLMPLLDSVVLKDVRTTAKIALMAFPLCSRGSLRSLIDRKVLDAYLFSSSSKRLRLPIRKKKKETPPPPPPSKSHEPWSVAEFASIFEGACDGARAIHAEGFSHRDIKPENILLADDGTALLMDFGSMAPARVSLDDRRDVLALQDEAAVNSTMPYRAPELWEPQAGTVLDATKADVWALGCLLWAMAFGYSPYEAEFTQNNNQKKNTTGGGPLLPPKIVETSHLRVLAQVPSPPLSKLPHADSMASFYASVEQTARLFLITNPDERPDADRAANLAAHLHEKSNGDSSWATFDTPIAEP